MQFINNETTVESDDPWKYVYLNKSEDIVNLDGDFTVDELKEIIGQIEHYKVDSK